MSIFALIFFIIILVGVFIFSIGLSLLRGVLSFFMPKRRAYSTTNEDLREESTSQPKHHEKIFSKEDGEYVDYEEID